MWGSIYTISTEPITLLVLINSKFNPPFENQGMNFP